MNTQKCGPLEARRVFRLRPYKHFGAGGAVFALFLGILIFLPINPVFPLLIAGGVAFGLYYYLESRLLVITCPYCRKDININTPWQCGFQGCQNLNVDEFPFVHECEHCHYIPKAYVCHHCGKTIFMTSDPQQMHAAKRLENLELPVKVVIKDLAQDKVSTQKDKIGDLQHDLEVATLEKKIEIVKKMPADAPAIKGETDRIKERIQNKIQNGKTALQTEMEELAKIRADFPNDPDMQLELQKIVQQAVFDEIQRMSGGF